MFFKIDFSLKFLNWRIHPAKINQINLSLIFNTTFWKFNKKARHRRHIFCPPILLKLLLERRSVFFEKDSSSAKLQFFWFFFAKHRSFGGKKTLLWSITTLCAYLSKFATFSLFWKNLVFDQKKPNYFLLEKSSFERIWEMLVFQLHSTANLLYLGDGEIQTKNRAIF